MTLPTHDALDYSWSRPAASALQAAGIKLVARYLSHDPTKDLSATEAEDLHAHLIGILLNWESEAGRPLLGAGAGAEDGTSAAARAEQVGAPHGLTIYYSCDRDTNRDQWPTIAGYYRAAGAVTAGRYKVGVYGEYDLINYLHGQGVVTAEWQTYAWSNGLLSPEADLYQFLNGQTVAGASVDLNRIQHPALLGAWWPGPQQPQPDPSGPAAGNITEDETMVIVYGTPPTAPLLISGGNAAVLADSESVRSLRAAGAQVAQVSKRDFDTIKVRFGQTFNAAAGGAQ